MLDSAVALARTPLFHQLSRIELAKLAGALREQEFGAGETIVREGDPGDGYYILKSGEARVVVGPGHVAPLRAGEGFGEMALLADVPRTATVVAHTSVAVWRLPTEEFQALLQGEHGIALAIARTLTHRLAARTREVGELQTLGRAMATVAARTLSPAARQLLAEVRLLPRWPAPALARACERTGQVGSLRELRDGDVFVRRDGEGMLAPLALAGVPAVDDVELDHAWLRAAAAELQASDDVLGAATIDCRAGEYESAVARLAAGQTKLLGAVPAARLAAWLHDAPDPRLAGEPRLADFRREVERRLDGAGGTPDPALRGLGWLNPLETGAIDGPAVARTIGSRRLAAAALAVAFYAVGWLLPTPDGLSRPGLVALAALAAMIPLTVGRVVPDYVAGVLLATSLVAPRVVGAEWVMSGFSSTSWLLLLLLFAISTSIAHSGLLYRIALLSLERLPSSFYAQSFALLVAGLVLTIGISDGTSRVALAAPAARDISDALHYPKRSRGSAALGLVSFLAFSELSNTFLTGSSWVLLVHGLMPADDAARFTWTFWLEAAIVPNLLFFVLSYGSIAAIFRPPRRSAIDRSTIRVQRELLGPPARAEIVSGVALLLMIGAYTTQGLHGVDAVWIAAGIFVLLFVTGALTSATFQSGVNWGLLVYGGVLLGVGPVFQTLGISAWLGSDVQPLLRYGTANPYTFVLAVGLAAFALRFVMPIATLIPLMALVTMPLAASVGYSPFVPAMVTLMVGRHTCLPYINTTYLAMYHMADGDLFSHEQARPALWLDALFRLVAVLLSVPYWRVLGLI